MNRIGLHKKRIGAWGTFGATLLTIVTAVTTVGFSGEPKNRITIENQSGQIAEVKVIGPERVFIKIPLDQKRTIRVNQGEYYLLVRYGFSPKEYIYTKSDPFLVTEPENQFSIITFTLHRVLSPMPGAHQVSGEEFENTKLHRTAD